MSLPTLGCAQIPNGTLRDASEIEFSFLCSPSPVHLSPGPAAPELALTPAQLNFSKKPQDPASGKAPKQK